MIKASSPSIVGALVLFAAASAVAQSPSAGTPICPTISVSCPADFNYRDPISFAANVRGGDPTVTPLYSWEVSAGRIVQGQGSASIQLDMSGFGGQSPTATVTIKGFDLTCSATASCSIIPGVPPPDPTRFDSYGSLSANNEEARLSAFAVQLANHPADRGYLLVYGGRRSRAGEAQTIGTRARDYLIKAHGITAERVVIVDAGYKEQLTADLWLVPTGASPPVAEPTVDPSEVTIIKAKKPRSPKH